MEDEYTGCGEGTVRESRESAAMGAMPDRTRAARLRQPVREGQVREPVEKERKKKKKSQGWSGCIGMKRGINGFHGMRAGVWPTAQPKHAALRAGGAPSARPPRPVNTWTADSTVAFGRKHESTLTESRAALMAARPPTFGMAAAAAAPLDPLVLACFQADVFALRAHLSAGASPNTKVLAVCLSNDKELIM